MPDEPARFFRIKNWDKYQDFHHKERKNNAPPPWIKLSTAFFDDAGLASLPDSQRLAWVALLISAACSRNRISWLPDRIKRRFGLGRKPDLDMFMAQGFIEKIDVDTTPLDKTRQDKTRTNVKLAVKSHVQLPPTAPEKASETDAVFAHWQQVMGKADSKLTPQRREKIQARLKDGYTVADILRAIDGNKASRFHQGENDRKTAFNDLTLICRSGEKLEWFRDMAGTKPAQRLVGPDLAALDAEADALGVKR